MTFWYLCTSYSRHPGGQEEAYEMAVKATALLIDRGASVYSPIVHSHPLMKHINPIRMNPLDFKAWERVNQPFIETAEGCIVYMDGDWHESLGTKAEVDWFTQRAKPVWLMSTTGDLFEWSALYTLNVLMP